MPESKPEDQYLPTKGTETSTVAVQATGPSALPPDSSQAASATLTASGAAVWLSNQKVTALWCINENRNSWAALSGDGWIKLANNSDSAIVALTMLVSHAKQMQTIVNCRQEDDKMIHEIYAW